MFKTYNLLQDFDGKPKPCRLLPHTLLHLDRQAISYTGCACAVPNVSPLSCEIPVAQKWDERVTEDIPQAQLYCRCCSRWAVDEHTLGQALTFFLFDFFNSKCSLKPWEPLNISTSVVNDLNDLNVSNFSSSRFPKSWCYRLSRSVFTKGPWHT